MAGGRGLPRLRDGGGGLVNGKERSPEETDLLASNYDIGVCAQRGKISSWILRRENVSQRGAMGGVMRQMRCLPAAIAHRRAVPSFNCRFAGAIVQIEAGEAGQVRYGKTIGRQSGLS